MINPQNGHILCDPKFLLCGLSAASSSVNVSVTEASRLQNVIAKTAKDGFHRSTGVETTSLGVWWLVMRSPILDVNFGVWPFTICRMPGPNS